MNDHRLLRELVGEFDAHLKLISGQLGVDIGHRGNLIKISADNGGGELAHRLLEELKAMIEEGHQLHPNDVRHALRMLRHDPGSSVRQVFSDTVLMNLENRPITARTAGQQRYVVALRSSDIVFGVGPAGTGKTYLAMAIAVAAWRRKETRRIILTRPAVEAGEKLGFLPGDLTEKVDPYLRPLYDALADMIPADEVARLMEKKVIEVAPLAFMRGRTLNDATVVLDEAQNTTVEQMRMFLTRLGDRGRMVITGDDSQVDLPRGKQSGLIHALEVLSGISKIQVVRLTTSDVVRHPLVGEIIDAYAVADKLRATGEAKPG